jgi:hypothetical protein
MLVAAIVDDASINYNLDAEITGFEGSMNVFLSENTSVLFNWLAITNEVTSDTALINYLNPIPALKVADLGPIGDGTGLLTGAAFADGTTLFKSGGYNCLSAPFAPLAGAPCPVAQGIPVSVEGNSLPGTADLSYSLSLTQVFPGSRGETSARLSYRYRGESNSSIFEDARMEIPATKYWDLLVRFTPGNGDWYVGMYAKNLADERQLQGLRTASNLQGGQLYGSFSDGRTWGLQFGFDY